MEKVHNTNSIKALYYQAFEKMKRNDQDSANDEGEQRIASEDEDIVFVAGLKLLFEESGMEVEEFIRSMEEEAGDLFRSL